MASTSLFSIPLPEKANTFIQQQGVQIIFHDSIHLLKDAHADTYTEFQSKLYKTCSGIGHEYFNNLFDYTMNDELQVNDLFDIVIVIKGTSPEDITVDNIIGFMIIEIGECEIKRYIHIPALNLICVSQKYKNIPVGRILLFIYVYTLLQRNYSTGLLELADHYYNLNALCLYNKFGFVESIPLKSKCFTHDDTLPMMVDITQEPINETNLLAALIENKNIPIADDEVLCRKNHKKGPGGPLQSMEQQQRKSNFENIMKINKLLVERNIELVLLNMDKNKIALDKADQFTDIIKILADKSRNGEKIHFVHRVPKSKSVKNKSSVPTIRDIKTKKLKSKSSTKTQTKRETKSTNN
jgi:hypothetical protein